MNIEQEVRQIVADQAVIEVSEVTLASKLDDDLELDSLDAVEICIGIEDTFHFDIPTEDIESLKTVSEIVSYVEKRLSNVTGTSTVLPSEATQSDGGPGKTS